MGDRLLLCSDGVTDYLADDQVAEFLEVKDAKLAVGQLVDAALECGSRDNITAVIADVVGHDRPDDGWLNALPHLDVAQEVIDLHGVQTP